MANGLMGGIGAGLSGFEEAFSRAQGRQDLLADRQAQRAMMQAQIDRQAADKAQQAQGLMATNAMLASLGQGGVQTLPPPPIGIANQAALKYGGQKVPALDIYGMPEAQQKALTGKSFAGADIGKVLTLQNAMQPKQQELTGTLGTLSKMYPTLSPDQILEKANQLKKSGAPSVSVDASQKGQNKFDEMFASGEAGRYNKIIDESDASWSTLNNINAMESLFSTGNVEQGKMADFKNSIGRIAESLNIDPSKLGIDGVAETQAVKSLTMKNLMVEMAKQKGAQTEHDAKRFMQSIASVGNTEEANNLILNFTKAMAMETQEKANFVTNYLQENGRSFGNVNNANSEWQKLKTSRPLFKTIQGKPITWYQFRDSAQKQGKDPNRVRQLWFAGGNQ